MRPAILYYAPGDTFRHVIDWTARLPTSTTIASAAVTGLPSGWTLVSESSTTTTHTFTVTIDAGATDGADYSFVSRITLSAGGTVDQTLRIHVASIVLGQAPIKDPDDANYPLTVDWTKHLPASVTVSSVVWTVPAGLTGGAESATSTTTTKRLTGGTAGTDYTLTLVVTLSNGEVLTRKVMVLVRTQ